MRYTVTEERLPDLALHKCDYQGNPAWPFVFVTPDWLDAWWRVFGADYQPLVKTVRRDGEIIGVAPLKTAGSTASFLGSADVCDYLDFIVVPGSEIDYFQALLDDLNHNGIKLLDLQSLRTDSTVLTSLVPWLRQVGKEVTISFEDVSLETALPAAFEDYLAGLNTKQRHEVRRKLRRLSEFGAVDYYFISDRGALPAAMDDFLRLFRESRQDKADFMTSRMEAFFRLLAASMSAAGFLKLGVLALDKTPVAMVMCFDYGDTRYLYNSGFDVKYNYAGVGLLSKVFAIKDSIESGLKKFDFLKGAEHYKYHLGGRELPLYRCQIIL
jgi:CelD/BcsL family acetyltransferase involved in cellulose biosynthesis